VKLKEDKARVSRLYICYPTEG